VTSLHAGLVVGWLGAQLYDRTVGAHRWPARAMGGAVCGGGVLAAVLLQSLPRNWTARTELRRAQQIVYAVGPPVLTGAETAQEAVALSSLLNAKLRAEAGVLHALQALHVAGMGDAAWVWVAQAAAQGAPVEVLRPQCPPRRSAALERLRRRPLATTWGREQQAGQQVCAAIAPLPGTQLDILAAAAAIGDARLRLHVAGELLFEAGDLQGALAQYLQAVPLDAAQRRYALWQFERRGRVQQAQALRVADDAARAGRVQPVATETWAAAAAYGAQLNFTDLASAAQRGVVASPPQLRSRFDADLQRAVIEADLPHGGAVQLILPPVPASLRRLRLLVQARSQTTVAATSTRFGSVQRQIMPGPWEVVDMPLYPTSAGNISAAAAGPPAPEGADPTTVLLLGDFALAAVGAPADRERSR
jgi:hypothetical protein